MKIIGLSGSLRKNSYNTAALRAAAEVAPEGVTVELADLSQIPMYNEDLRGGGWPAPVDHLASQIRSADALLFATPEYNFSIPGMLKNAIDWVSRYPDQPFAGKAAGVMGASMGPLGTARSQYHLRQMGVYLDMHFVNKPEVFIGTAQNKFDAEGKLTDEATREFLRKLVVALAGLGERLKR
jgi:chromate reductase, NAD(P)H dehydrogenase (quinone)